MQLSDKGQSAVEYLMIIALTLVIIVPTTYMFFQFSSSSNDVIADSQYLKAGRTLVSSAETVYYSGRDSKLEIDLKFPDGLNGIYIVDNKELVFNVSTSIGYQELVFFSNVNISTLNCSGVMCTLPGVVGSGLETFKLQSIDNGRQILFSKP